jgi:hypothetical protein
MWFGDFITYMAKFCVDRPVAVGINPHSLDWIRLHRRLNRCNQSVIAGDFSNWDGKCPAFMMDKICDYINEWYDDGPENFAMRKMIFKNVTHATRVHDQFIYQVKRGMPSGFYGTAEFNSMCQTAMNFLVMETLNIPLDQYEFTVYGDDNVICINRPGITWKTLSPIYKELFDMDYTHFLKDTVEDVVDTLQTVKFIGRKFVRADSYYHAPLDLQTIFEMVYWYKSGVDEVEVLLSTINTYFLELFHHGPAVHKKYSIELLVAVKRRIPEIYDAVQEMNKPWFYYHDQMYVERRIVPDQLFDN